jgi:hypothetical protein
MREEAGADIREAKRSGAGRQPGEGRNQEPEFVIRGGCTCGATGAAGAVVTGGFTVGVVVVVEVGVVVAGVEVVVGLELGAGDAVDPPVVPVELVVPEVPPEVEEVVVLPPAGVLLEDEALLEDEPDDVVEPPPCWPEVPDEDCC